MATKASNPSTNPSTNPSRAPSPIPTNERTLLKNFFNHLDTYFSTPSSTWSLHAFEQHISTYPYTRPERYVVPAESWYSRLTKIAKCKPPFGSASPADVSAAKCHLSKRKTETARSANPPAAPAAVPGITTSNLLVFLGAANIISGNMSGCTVNGTTTTKPVEAEGSSVKPPKKRQRRGSVETVDTEVTPAPSTLDAEAGQPAAPPSPTDQVIDTLPSSEYKLPSGTLLHAAIKTFLSTSQPAMKKSSFVTDLQFRYLFPHDPSTRLLFPPCDIHHLQSLLPTLPPVSITFESFLTAHQFYLTSNHPLHLPTYPQEIIRNDEIIKKEWLYIHASILHFCTHFPTLQTRALSHGEGWCDVNIWAHLLDTALLFSETLSLDRKELQSCVDAPAAVWVVSNANKTGLPIYDGIVRSANGGGSCGGVVGTRLDLGFVEVKPARAPYPKSSRTDREKVIRAMAASLRGFHELEASAPIDAGKDETDTKSSPPVIVIGLICNGLSMTLIRAWRHRESGCVLFAEQGFELEIATLPAVLAACWRVKMGLEETLGVVKGWLPVNRMVW